MHLWFKYRGENNLLPSFPPPPSPLVGLGLHTPPPIFHPNGTVYFLSLQKKISVKSPKMDHPRAGSSRAAAGEWERGRNNSGICVELKGGCTIHSH